MDKKTDLEMGMAIDYRNKLRALMFKYAGVMRPEIVARETHNVANEMESAQRRANRGFGGGTHPNSTPATNTNTGHSFSWEDIESIR